MRTHDQPWPLDAFRINQGPHGHFSLFKHQRQQQFLVGRSGSPAQNARILGRFLQCAFDPSPKPRLHRLVRVTGGRRPMETSGDGPGCAGAWRSPLPSRPPRPWHCWRWWGARGAMSLGVEVWCHIIQNSVLVGFLGRIYSRSDWHDLISFHRSRSPQTLICLLVLILILILMAVVVVVVVTLRPET